jgi:ABC-type multidrug transport system ATPase subunit
MTCTFRGRQIEVGEHIPLTGELAIGRAGSTTDRQRQNNAGCLYLESNNASIRELEADSCQLHISRRNGRFFVEDRNPGPASAKLNGTEFVRSRLLINDRVTIGDQFHFQFDGLSLRRVGERQGAKIELHHLSKTYGGPQPAISDLTLTIAPNEFIGILGPSGCGKSTLMNMMCGAIQPSSGSVIIGGVSISEYPAQRQSLVGLVPQDDIVHPELTVWQAVSMSAKLRLAKKVIGFEKLDLAEDIVARLGLWEWRHHPICKLSGGQRKRASIAVELLRKNRVLFLDEPSSGLDPSKEEDLMVLLRRLANQGQTIVCTTHILDRSHLFDRILIITRGVCVFFGRAEDAPPYFGKETLNEVYRLIDDKSYAPKAHDRRDEQSASSASKTSLVQALSKAEFEQIPDQPVGIKNIEHGFVVEFLSSGHDPGITSDLLLNLVESAPPRLILDLSRLEEVSDELLASFEEAISFSRKNSTFVSIISSAFNVRSWLHSARKSYQVHVFDDLDDHEAMASHSASTSNTSPTWQASAILIISVLSMTAFAYTLTVLFR